MTALAVPPRRFPASDSLVGISGRSESFDRRVLIVAAASALLLHLAMFFVPLPTLGVKQLEAPVAPEPPRLISIDIPPPDRPESPPVRDPEPVHYLRPVPFRETPDLEPVTETPSPDAVDLGDFPEVPVSPGEPVPPPAPQILEETVEGLVSPVPLDRIHPEYPERARLARVEGRVVLLAVIGENGEVVSLEVLHASWPDLGFSEAAIEAVSQWRYEPGTYHGRPVKVRMRVVVEFTLL